MQHLHRLFGYMAMQCGNAMAIQFAHIGPHWVKPFQGETADGSGGREGIWPPHQISEPINANLIRFNVQQCNAVLCVTMHCSTDSEDATSRMRQSSIQKQM